jgi:hypothetical protein
MGKKTSTPPQVFRQRTPLVLGAVCAVIGMLLLVSLARGWGHSPQPLFLAWVLFALAAVWALFLRPAVLLDKGGVTVRNIVRDVHIPWGVLTDVESRWNLKVLVGDRGYTAWAISSQVERPKRASGGMLGALSGRVDRHAAVDTRPSTPSPKVTASMVARSVEQAKADYDEAVARGALPATPQARVRVTWAPLVVAILLVPALAVVALSLA